ncbi:hypothetical protein K438DRAFT_1945279 [Mycena galopus ATCC 62051]|nr:hypothetical protein K438DRAFT_1945279 [Mycena galopus ATCC 62051]
MSDQPDPIPKPHPSRFRIASSRLTDASNSEAPSAAHQLLIKNAQARRNGGRQMTCHARRNTHAISQAETILASLRDKILNGISLLRREGVPLGDTGKFTQKIAARTNQWSKQAKIPAPTDGRRQPAVQIQEALAANGEATQVPAHGAANTTASPHRGDQATYI